MFVPIGLLLQNEKVVTTKEQLVEVLDRWVLPSYPQFTTTNPLVTKTQCFGVMHSYYASGKLHIKLRAEDIEMAVNAFLEDRLWVNQKTLSEIEVSSNQDPKNWIVKPTMLRCLTAIPKVLFEATYVLLSLLKTGVMYTFYSMMPVKKFVIPKQPSVPAKRSGDNNS